MTSKRRKQDVEWLTWHRDKYNMLWLNIIGNSFQLVLVEADSSEHGMLWEMRE